MGKPFPSPKSLPHFTRIAAAARIKNPRPASPKPLASPNETSTSSAGAAGRRMESGERRGDARLPLSEVVSDCVKRWFQDALKEARAGDTAMQVLVRQMYQSGYGIARSEQKEGIRSQASKYQPFLRSGFLLEYRGPDPVATSVPRGIQAFYHLQAKAWITKASRYRSSVWKVSEKRPGYNASDSDSDEVKDDTK